MGYSINADFFTSKLGLDLECSLDLIKNIGFDGIDYTSSDLRQPECIERACLENELIRSKGLYVCQTHAPYNRYNQYGDCFALALERAYEITRIFGAKYFVVHGDEFDFKNDKYSPQKALVYNYEIYAPYVEKAARDGIAVAFETVFQDMSPEIVRFTSKAEELLALLEKFNSPSAVCCWDTGHAHISFGNEQADKIRLLGKHIKCTHIHDNRLGQDLHLPLFTGDSDLLAIRRAFADIEYDGIFSLELGGATKMNLLPEGVEAFTKYSYEALKCFDALK